MLLLSIKLKNFRQFREGEINFADGKDKRNVTIILGDNGSGRVSTWLYPIGCDIEYGK